MEKNFATIFKEKIKTFDSELGDVGEVLEKAPPKVGIVIFR